MQLISGKMNLAKNEELQRLLTAVQPYIPYVAAPIGLYGIYKLLCYLVPGANSAFCGIQYVFRSSTSVQAQIERPNRPNHRVNSKALNIIIFVNLPGVKHHKF
jgi:hypothetical protein